MTKRAPLIVASLFVALAASPSTTRAENLLTKLFRRQPKVPRTLPGPGDYRPDQRPAQLMGASPDGSSVTVSNMRWGFKERHTSKPFDQLTPAEKQAWKPRFQDTRIQTGKVKEVYLMMEPFKPELFAGHAILGFEFERGREMVGRNGKKARGLALSVEARLEKNEPYGLIRGMKDQFEIVYQLGTMKDTYQKVLKRQDHKLIKHKLKLTQAQKDKLLANTLAEATKDRTGEKYHTTRNSCYQNVQRLINSVLPRRQRVREWLFRIPLPGGRSFGLYNPLATWPKAGPFMLSLKGLVKRRDRVKSLPKSMMRKYRKRVKPGKPAPASAVAFRGTHQTGYSPRNRPTVRSQQGSWRQLVSSRYLPRARRPGVGVSRATRRP
jgi:hypothetical protein